MIANYTGIAGSSYTLTNVAAGVYSVTLTDKYGCSTTQSITLADMPALTASISVSTNGGGCLTAGNAATLTLSMTTETWNAYRASGNNVYYSFDNGASWHPMRTLMMRQLSQQVCTTPNQVLHYKFVLQHVKPLQVPMYVLQQRVLI